LLREAGKSRLNFAFLKSAVISRYLYSFAVFCCSLPLFLSPMRAYAQRISDLRFADDQLWEFGGWSGEAVGKAGGEGFGRTLITMAGFEAGRIVYRAPSAPGHESSLVYMVQMQLLFLVTRRQGAYGGGFSPVGLKWNFAPRGRYRPYVQFDGGGMFTQENVPAGRTSSFNFTVAAGPGVMVALPHNQALSVALQYWHLSNANLGARNPAFNTIEIVVGYHWIKTLRISQSSASASSDAEAK
jgi:Lipid A 3-O-deacylase (PagL)